MGGDAVKGRGMARKVSRIKGGVWRDSEREGWGEKCEGSGKGDVEWRGCKKKVMGRTWPHLNLLCAQRTSKRLQ